MSLKSHLLIPKKILIWGMVVGVVFSFTASSGAREILSPGFPAPSLELPNLANKTVNLASFYGKKAILLTFFTTWSKSCQEELAYLKSLHKKYKYKLEIVAVSFDKKSSKLAAFVKAHNIPFVTLIDKKHRYLGDYRILIIPSTYLIDKNGVLKGIFVDFNPKVQKILGEKVAGLLE